MSRRITVRGVVYRDGKLFAVRHRANVERGMHFWCTPGGGLYDGESLHNGLRREIREETGITAEIGRLLFVQQFRKTSDELYKHDEFLEFFFEITNVDKFDTIDLTTTSHGETELAEFAWVDPRDVDFLPTFLRTVDFTTLDHQALPLFFNDL